LAKNNRNITLITNFFWGGFIGAFLLVEKLKEQTDRQEIEGTDNNQALSASFNFRQAVIASCMAIHNAILYQMIFEENI
jgi:hypothetical protein